MESPAGSIAGCLDTDTAGETNTNGDDTVSTAPNADESDTSTGVAEDGWAEPHGEVEIPDESGTAVLQIGGETVTFGTPVVSVEENPDGAGPIGADQFEAQVLFGGGEHRNNGLQVEFTRLLGYENTDGRWAESDALSLARDDGT